MNLYRIDQFSNKDKSAYKTVIVTAVNEEEALDTMWRWVGTLPRNAWSLSEKDIEISWLGTTKLYGNREVVLASKEER